jgi:hypothetical protein
LIFHYFSVLRRYVEAVLFCRRPEQAAWPAEQLISFDLLQRSTQRPFQRILSVCRRACKVPQFCEPPKLSLLLNRPTESADDSKPLQNIFHEEGLLQLHFLISRSIFSFFAISDSSFSICIFGSAVAALRFSFLFSGGTAPAEGTASSFFEFTSKFLPVGSARRP